MQHLLVKKNYIKTDLKNPIDDLMANVMRDIHPDLKIAVMSGCEIETIFLNETDGIKLIIKTKYPISILKDNKGNVYDIVQNKAK